MTVCAAVICRTAHNLGGEEFAIIGISDRMLTSGDIEYEPRNQTKIHALVPAKAVALQAGDSAVNLSVTRKTQTDLQSDGVTGIEAIARLQGDNYIAFRKNLVEKSFLAPFGLDIDSFVTRQHQFREEVANDLVARIQFQELNAVSIICGFDDNGTPHVYIVSDRGETTCLDGVGFCAAGYGDRQFQSLFLFHEYDLTWPLQDALFLTFCAKKRAESSPGVGKLTDMFILDPKRGFTKLIPESAMRALGEHYNRLDQASRRLHVQALGKLDNDARLKEIFARDQ